MLYHDILAHSRSDRLPFTLKRIGDCEAPAIIAAAVYSGHRYARELDVPVNIDDPLAHDRVDVGDTIIPTICCEGESVVITGRPSQQYLDTLLLYYEEEVQGEAYFNGIADRLSDPDHQAKMQLMAKVENFAAASVLPLIRKHNLETKTGH